MKRRIVLAFQRRRTQAVFTSSQRTFDRTVLRKVPFILVSVVLSLFFSDATSAAERTIGFVYCVGQDGELQKMDMDLNVVATAKVPGLVRAVRIHAADISPDGTRLFLATSRPGRPLAIVETSDLTVETDATVTFPDPADPWQRNFPFDIIAASPDILCWSDECYTADPTRPYSTLLVDLNAGIAKPIYDWSFGHGNSIQVSPGQKEMIVCDRGLALIQVSTGQVLAKVEQETIGPRSSIRWFDVDWGRHVVHCLTVPWGTGNDSPEKLSIDMNSGKLLQRERIAIPDGFRFPGLQTNRQQSSLTRTYVFDKGGDIHIFDHSTDMLSREPIRTGLYAPPGSPSCLYLSPAGHLIIAQGHCVETFTDGRDSRYFSVLYAIDAQTGRLIKPVYYPEVVVAVLFGPEFPEPGP